MVECGTDGVCLADCTQDSDCREGYECSDFDEDGTNECAPQPPTPPSNLGAACAADADCDGGDLQPFCIPEVADNMGMMEETGFPGGQCRAVGCQFPVENGQEFIGIDGGCGGTNLCFPFDDGQGGSVGVCLQSCSDNSGCERMTNGMVDNSYSCGILGTLDNMGTLEPIGVCEPACASDADCEFGDGMGGTVQGVCNSNNYCERPCDPADAMSCGGGDFQCTDNGSGTFSCSYMAP